VWRVEKEKGGILGRRPARLKVGGVNMKVGVDPVEGTLQQ